MAPFFSPDAGNQERLSQADETMLLMYEDAATVDAAVPTLRNALYGEPVRDITPNYPTVDHAE